MTLTRYEGLALEQVVRKSRLILAVRKEQPFESREMVPIHEDAKLHPPYPKNKLRFRVLEVLHDRAEHGFGKAVGEMEVKAGTVIEAVDHEWGTLFHCYKLYELENRGKSPIIERYETSADLSKESDVLLFVSRISEKDVYYLGYESMSRKDEILNMTNDSIRGA